MGGPLLVYPASVEGLGLRPILATVRKAAMSTGGQTSLCGPAFNSVVYRPSVGSWVTEILNAEPEVRILVLHPLLSLSLGFPRAEADVKL